MNGSEWNGIVAVLTANWPHSLPPDEALAKWGQDLAGEDPRDVLVAVESLYRDGREFAPNGAQISARIGELRRSDPDAGEAWAIVNGCPYSVLVPSLPDEPTSESKVLAWIEERSPAAAEAARRFGLRDLAVRDLSNESTHRAQFRRIYEGVVEDRRRNHAQRSLADGIRRLQGPQKPDYIGSLVLGGGEETS